MCEDEGGGLLLLRASQEPGLKNPALQMSNSRYKITKRFFWRRSTFSFKSVLFLFSKSHFYCLYIMYRLKVYLYSYETFFSENASFQRSL